MLSGFIMSGNTAVARFSGCAVTPIYPELAPLCFRNGGDLKPWLEMRAMDHHRPNGRILKRLLRLGDTSDWNTALHVHGAAITDQYWVKTDGEQDLRWEDVRFTRDDFADVALHGAFASFSKPYTPEQLRAPTPELTNIGRFEKCWRLIDGKWVILKQETIREIYSEVFTARLGKHLGFRMADYHLVDGCVAAEDFTEGCCNFEPMAYITGDNEDYADNYEALRQLKPGLEREYLEILFLDALVFNTDRHTQNFGILRDRKTGEILSMAPNFDNNMALISSGYAADPQNLSNRLVDRFRALKSQKGISEPFPALDDKEVRAIAEDTMPEADIDRDYVVWLVMGNYEKLLMR